MAFPLLSTEEAQAIREMLQFEGLDEFNNVIQVSPGQSIQEAVDDAGQGAAIKFGEGEYVTPPILYDSEIAFVGTPNSTTIKLADGSDDHLFRDRNGDEEGVEWHHLELDVNRANNGGGAQGIRARPSQNAGDEFLLNHVDVHDAPHNCVQIGGDHVRINRLMTQNAGNNGITGGGNHRHTTGYLGLNHDNMGFSVGGRDCRDYGVHVRDTQGTGLNVEPGHQSLVAGFTVEDCGRSANQAVSIRGGEGVTLRDGTVDQSTAGGNLIRAFPLSSATGEHQVHGVHLIGDGTATGVIWRADASNPQEDDRVVDCQLEDLGTGILIQNSGGGVTLIRSTRNEFENVTTPHDNFDKSKDHFLPIIDGVAFERQNAEEPTRAWPDGTMVRFEDSGDGSGTGHYYITRGGAPVQLN